MIQEVSDNTRYGDSALRFELRKGGCGSTKNDIKKGTSWDCGKNKSERTELTPANDDKQIGFKGNVWQTLSFYVEKVPYEDGQILFGRSITMVIGHQCLTGQLKEMVFTHKEEPPAMILKFIKRKMRKVMMLSLIHI